MRNLLFPFRVSRPRFWIYIFGPYIVGLAAAAPEANALLEWRIGIFALFFLLPANLLIYGINDTYDYETDKINEKKNEYEALVAPDRRKTLAIWILATNLPFLAAALVFAPSALLALAGFLFFSVFYSAPPIRAKAVPFLDSAFNVLYVFPAAFAYQMVTGSFPPVTLMIAAACWTAAMHAYSAIPDIEADRKAGIATIATFLGGYTTLAVCSGLYTAAALLSFEYLGLTAITLGSAYLLLMIASVQSLRTGRIFKLYKAFPLINIVAGFVLFWAVVL